MEHRLNTDIRYLFGVAAILLLAAPGFARGQTALRWKLTPGEKLAVEVTQQTASEVAYASARTATQIDLAMSLQWEVVSAEAGKVVLRQTLERFVFNLESPNAGKVEYDSAQEARPRGLARDVAAAVEPLLTTAIEITMNERGQVLNAKAQGEGGETSAAPAVQSSQTVVSKESIQKLLRQPLAVLPEGPVKRGDTWTADSEFTTALGKAKQTITYRYAGPVEEEGRPLDKIETSSTLRLDDGSAAASKLKLQSHEQSGAIYFDSAAGRLASAEQTQKLITERPYRETTIVVSLTTQQRTVVRESGQR